MTLAARIALGMLLLVGLLVGLATWQLRAMDRLAESTGHLAGDGLELRRQLQELRSEVVGLSEFTARFSVLRDPAYSAELAERRAATGERLETIASLSLSGLSQAASALDERWKEYAVPAGRREEALLRGRGSARDELLRALDDVVEAIEALDSIVDREQTTLALSAADQAARARGLAAGVVALALLGGLFATLMVVRSVAVPIGRLREGALTLGGGDLTHRVPGDGPPEIAALASDFNAMADRLEELEELKRGFVATVSHDLKSPLASIRETLTLLLDGSLGAVSEEQKEILELQRGSVDRLTRMIHDLLDLASLDAGGLEIRRKPEDLVAVVRRVLLEMQPLLKPSGLSVATRFPPEPVTALVDAERLHQVVQNLLTNAIDHSPEDGAIEVTVDRSVPEGGGREEPGVSDPRPSPGGVLVAIGDRGPGVPEAHKERIFDRFHRLDRSMGASKGTGLGLPIARAIVAAHDGRIRIEGRPGGGSVFVVELPAAPDPADSRSD